jgi:hypothetical protein
LLTSSCAIFRSWWSLVISSWIPGTWISVPYSQVHHWLYQIYFSIHIP